MLASAHMESAMPSVLIEQSEIRQWLVAQTAHVDIAVSSWRSGSIETLGLQGPNIRILLDLTSPTTDPAEVARLQQRFGAAAVRHSR